MSAAACAKAILCGTRAMAEIEAGIASVEIIKDSLEEKDFEYSIKLLEKMEADGKRLNEFLAKKAGDAPGY